MKRFIRFLELDVTIQLLLMIITAMSTVTFIGLLFTMPVLGIYQILSAVIGYCFLKEQKYLLYLGVCFFVLSLMGVVISADFGFLAVVALFFIVPIIMAIWYYKFTKRTLQRLNNNDYTEYRTAMEDLLDDDIVWV